MSANVAKRSHMNMTMTTATICERSKWHGIVCGKSKTVDDFCHTVFNNRHRHGTAAAEDRVSEHERRRTRQQFQINLEFRLK